MHRFPLIAAANLAFATAWAATPLSTVIDEAVRSGTDVHLPPNLSTVLGLNRRHQPTPVKQLAFRDGQVVHAFNVDLGHRHEIVLFAADEASRVTTAYLMTPAGRLRKVVTYHQGEPPVTIPRAHAEVGFASERDMWTHRDTLRPH